MRFIFCKHFQKIDAEILIFLYSVYTQRSEKSALGLERKLPGIDDRTLRKRARINAIRTRLRSPIIGALTRPKFTISDGAEYIQGLIGSISKESENCRNKTLLCEG